MSDLRFDRITGKAVVISEKRGDRPHDIDKKKDLSTCPFCPGNEEKTPYEIFSIGNPWNVRVVPNKFPAIDNKKTLLEQESFHTGETVIGTHYVIIDSDKHFNYLHKMSIDEIKNLISCYKAVVKNLYNNENIKYVQLFKNYKKEGGASLQHTHSQAISMNFYPENICRILKNSKEYYKENNSCLFCDLIKYELSKKKRIVFENSNFIVITPYASLFPYEVAIYPKKHSSNFISIDEEKISDLSHALSFIIKKFYKNLNDPAYNLYLNNIKSPNEYFHWSISIIPRTTTIAGFELSTGVMINVVSPEQARDILSN
ncbi:galactose-1-phosphate uridylyltransferase [Clostridium ganghwense]|uniref:Galactose-1-phosphate uridylyltransferase n=1 Tax=Clostridium ganghwense TaxID=312089 RepID=A0ABT4CL40_9CLOT|nr:galactose-1-phosphate uridylyltransferase [Clostridium ganghwense]MCY6369743.1 galactose-1-phosphate uridylyltransferase [Clostridium ganghwense]